MKDDNERLLADLLRTAVSDPAGPESPDAVVARGQRRLRRRRWGTVGAAGLTVAGVVLAATVLPGVGDTSTVQPAASSPTPTVTKAEQPEKEMPGKPGRHGRDEVLGAEDRPLRLLSAAEAATRCRQQWTAQAGRDVGPVTMRPRFFVFDLADRPFGLTPAELKPFEDARDADLADKDGKGGIGQPVEWYGYWPGTPAPVTDGDGKAFTCMIPGEWVPSAADLAADRQGSIPTDDAGLLRRCSTIFWHDFSRWQVVARQVEPGVAASIAATSPSGKLAVKCVVTEQSLRTSATGLYNAQAWMPMVSGTRAQERLELGQLGLAHGGTWSCEEDCAGWVYKSVDRLPANVAKLVAKTPQGRTINVPVREGWYALAFAQRDRGEQNRSGKGTLTAYDASGKKLGSTEFWSVKR